MVPKCSAALAGPQTQWNVQDPRRSWPPSWRATAGGGRRPQAKPGLEFCLNFSAPIPHLGDLGRHGCCASHRITSMEWSSSSFFCCRLVSNCRTHTLWPTSHSCFHLHTSPLRILHTAARIRLVAPSGPLAAAESAPFADTPNFTSPLPMSEQTTTVPLTTSRTGRPRPTGTSSNSGNQGYGG